MLYIEPGMEFQSLRFNMSLGHMQTRYWLFSDQICIQYARSTPLTWIVIGILSKSGLRRINISRSLKILCFQMFWMKNGWHLTKKKFRITLVFPIYVVIDINCTLREKLHLLCLFFWHSTGPTFSAPCELNTNPLFYIQTWNQPILSIFRSDISPIAVEFSVYTLFPVVISYAY